MRVASYLKVLQQLRCRYTELIFEPLEAAVILADEQVPRLSHQAFLREAVVDVQTAEVFVYQTSHILFHLQVKWQNYNNVHTVECLV